MENELINKTKILTDALLKAGAYFGYSKSRRHPSTKQYIYGAKGGVEIFDIKKTALLLDDAKEFMKGILLDGGMILFVGTKYEAKKHVLSTAQELDMPYITERWIGGTMTNFSEIKKRVARLEDLLDKKEKGELAKYTKKERLLLDREVADLERKFGGIVSMKKTPNAIFIIDPKHENTAIAEAKTMNIPVIAVASSDCNISSIEYPVVANDASSRSIKMIMEDISADLTGVSKVDDTEKKDIEKN